MSKTVRSLNREALNAGRREVSLSNSRLLPTLISVTANMLAIVAIVVATMSVVALVKSTPSDSAASPAYGWANESGHDKEADQARQRLFKLVDAKVRALEEAASKMPAGGAQKNEKAQLTEKLEAIRRELSGSGSANRSSSEGAGGSSQEGSN